MQKGEEKAGSVGTPERGHAHIQVCGSPVWSLKEELMSALRPPAPFPRQLESYWLLYSFYIAQTNSPMARLTLFMQLFHLLAHLPLVGRRGVFIPGKKKNL